MKTKIFLRGFTLMEMIVAMSVIVMIASITIGTLPKFQRTSDLNATAEGVVSLLTEARIKTISSSEDGSQFGVYLEADRAVLFKGTTYSEGAPGNREFLFPGTTELSSIDINGGGDQVVFGRLTGATNEYGTLTIINTRGGFTHRRVHILAFGSVSLENTTPPPEFISRDYVKISDSLNGGPAGLDSSDRFGSSIASIGDLDGDSVTDLAVGASGDENIDEGEGAIHILFMNTDGTVKSSVKISDSLNGGPAGLDSFDYFGSSVSSIGDLDGDSVTDLAVGASGDENVDPSEGAIHILFMNTDGTVKSSVKISDSLNGGPAGLDEVDFFGNSLASIGDLDGDSVTDLAVGALGDENTDEAEGAIYILFMNTDGTVKSSVKISDSLNGGPAGLDSSDRFGSSVASIGDLDGDSVTDLVVGASRDENIDEGEGAIHILFMNTDGTVKSSVKISDSLNGGPAGLDFFDDFGSSVASIGDLDGDGFADLAVGALGDENTDEAEGAMYILFMDIAE
jgi:prepilin-type N-terminal cleavage/methylation domain-containing protein